MTRLRRLLFDSCPRLHVIRRVLRGICGAVALGLLQDAAVFAQQGGGTTIVVHQPTPWLESLVVVVLCGAALFAVCRSSRRN